ncbi:helix-turn-helix transcriptional regulator [Micromonospora rifamycinica]|uniref:helix-turn-helix domain-containing protein n=1 Tax=Micromonospora rifamycinica TaxID=291594 RepID=UPI003428E927
MQVDNTLSGTPTGRLRDSVVVAVRVEMARQRMSQTKLAELTGCTQAYISRRMTGETPFDVVDLEKVARALNVPVAAFFPAPALVA